MTTVKTQGINHDEWLLSTGNGEISITKAVVTVTAGTPMPSGTVLGKIAATGKYVKANDASSDGSQTAVAILSTRLDGADLVAAGGDNPAVIYDKDVEAIGSLLNGGAGPDSTSVAELRLVGIKVR